jgi:hypothetical protein
MAFGSKKQTVIAKPSFKERLTVAKSMFKKAHEDGVRLVNINTIKQLIFNGVKYVVE